jgi:hypothetical protein
MTRRCKGIAEISRNQYAIGRFKKRLRNRATKVLLCKTMFEGPHHPKEIEIL